jgi:hypothetical protein
VGLIDLVNVGERNKIIVDVLDDYKGFTSFYWCIREERGKIINK